MDLVWERGPRGPKLAINGLQQWSAYDPAKEASRWIETLDLPNAATLFLAGDSGGHVRGALESQRPEVRVVVLVPEPDPDKVWSWWPQKGDLAEFLGEALGRTGPFDCHWAVWPAFERAAPNESLAWGHTFRDVFRTVQGTWLTWRHSGRLWWRNAGRNARSWAHPVELTRGARPIVVVASGPTLDAGWDTLRAVRADIELWALPSSFQALRLRGLAPDVAVCTDGGFWAKEHVQRLAGTDTVFLAALSSASDPVLEGQRTLFFGQGLPWERWLLDRWPGRASEVPAQGTVAVTALQWALASTTGPVLIAGLDLCFSDYRAHTQGHTTERRLSTSVSRLRPWETLWGERALEQAPLVLENGQRTSPAMRTYAAWLGVPGRWSRIVYRIAGSAIPVSGMTNCDWSELATVVAGGRKQEPVRWVPPVEAWPSEGQRQELLVSAKRDLRLALLEGRFSAAELRRWAETLAPEALARELARLKNPRIATAPSMELSEVLATGLDELDRQNGGGPP